MYPWIGERPIAEIYALELLAVLQKVEDRGAIETADRVLMLCRQIWDYWIPTATVAHRNITQGLKKRLAPHRSKTFAVIVEPVQFGELLRAMTIFKCGTIVRTALQLAPLVYKRPGNLREMEWIELDLELALCRIPSAKMKGTKAAKEQGDPHVVPLPTQAVALLSDLRPITGDGHYVFHGERSHDRPINDNSVRRSRRRRIIS